MLARHIAVPWGGGGGGGPSCHATACAASRVRSALACQRWLVRCAGQQPTSTVILIRRPALARRTVAEEAASSSARRRRRCWSLDRCAQRGGVVDLAKVSSGTRRGTPARILLLFSGHPPARAPPRPSFAVAPLGSHAAATPTAARPTRPADHPMMKPPSRDNGAEAPHARKRPPPPTHWGHERPALNRRGSTHAALCVRVSPRPCVRAIRATDRGERGGGKRGITPSGVGRGPRWRGEEGARRCLSRQRRGTPPNPVAPAREGGRARLPVPSGCWKRLTRRVGLNRRTRALRLCGRGGGPPPHCDARYFSSLGAPGDRATGRPGDRATGRPGGRAGGRSAAPAPPPQCGRAAGGWGGKGARRRVPVAGRPRRARRTRCRGHQRRRRPRWGVACACAVCGRRRRPPPP